MKPFKSKAEVRERFERDTDPNTLDAEQLAGILHSQMMAGITGLRSAIKLMREYTDRDSLDFPSEEHRIITERVMSGVSERMTAFELEVISVFTDLAWEINECNCQHCKDVDAEMQAMDKARKAKYN